MCGIVGYVGNNNCVPILYNGLLKLEYRGYDSAGIAIVTNNNDNNSYNGNSYIKIIKDTGRVKNLEGKNLSSLIDLVSNVGIAHTRWATHGKPCKKNAHPHLDNTNTFAVVHNGIIENYSELRAFLEDNGYHFFSDTDTEVIPNLIHYYYYFNNKSNDKSTDRGNTIPPIPNDELRLLKAVVNCCKKLNGSYAIEVICKFYNNLQIVVRKDSPLVIGKGNNQNFIASDIPAILPYTKDFYFLDDNEFAIVKKDNICFYDSNLKKHPKELKNVNLETSSSEKNGYEDYMLKEIFEQPTAIKDTIKNNTQNTTQTSINLDKNCIFDELNFSKDFLKSINKIYIVACGTAMHAGLCGKTAIEKLCKITTIVDIASEFRYSEPLINETTLCIFISQSGETADTIAALKLAKSKGAKTIAISNVIASSITREADYTIYTYAGPEIAVASTKAYTCQIVVLCILAIYFSEILESCSKSVLDDLKLNIIELPIKIESILSNTNNIKQLKQFADKVYCQKDIFFLGRGTDYNVAREGSLKLKEISYIHSEAYAGGELKHGPIALIEKGISIIATLTDSKLLTKSISNIQEVITRGATTFIITNQDICTNNFDYIFKIPSTTELLSPILSIIPMQLLAYYIAKNKNLDVDKPRNLAKSVTVE